MKVKVCGLNNLINILELANLDIDFMGFIFYQNSPRCCDGIIDANLIANISSKTQKVGVFVNETKEKIKEAVQKYNLDYAQLHGDESVEFCKGVQQFVKVIKVFSIKDEIEVEQMITYESYCDYFLFDTASNWRGGSGKQFNWQLLQNYNLDTPFFLSGGIALKDVEELKKIKHAKLIGVDVNSKFEIEPGIKDSNTIEQFIKRIKL